VFLSVNDAESSRPKHGRRCTKKEGSFVAKLRETSIYSVDLAVTKKRVFSITAITL